MSKIARMRRNQVVKAAVAATAAGLIPISISRAASLTWNGGGTDSNWGTVFNWSPAQAPASGDDLTFDGFGRLANVNNLSGLTINGITFASTAGAFSLSGNQITLGGDITDNVSVLTEANSLPMILSGSRNVGDHRRFPDSQRRGLGRRVWPEQDG